MVVGGSDAGISAALRARELDGSAEVTVVMADAYPNYSICGLPFYLSGETPDWHALAHRTCGDIEAAGVHLLLDHVAEHVDVPGQTLHVRPPSAAAVNLSYDQLIIATGAQPIVPPLPGVDLPGVHVLHTMEHSFAIDEALTAGARTVVVVGAGYIGVEMADALTRRGVNVTLVEMADSVLTTVDGELGGEVAAELSRHGVEVATGTTVAGISSDGERLIVGGTPDFERHTDLVLVAVSVRPATGLAETAGATLGHGGAVSVDRGMHTAVPGVYAAGDCAETWLCLLERPAYLPLGTTAHKQGRVAGENAVGGCRDFAGSLGTQVVKVFNLAVARTGLRQEEAIAAGLDALTSDVTVDDHKAYYPGAVPLRIRLTGDRSSGRLLGAQLLGGLSAQVAKRVDICATAIFHGMTVDALVDLDLAYTPPFSSPWDPVQMAAQDWTVQRRGARVERVLHPTFSLPPPAASSEAT